MQMIRIYEIVRHPGRSRAVNTGSSQGGSCSEVSRHSQREIGTHDDALSGGEEGMELKNGGVVDHSEGRIRM